MAVSRTKHFWKRWPGTGLLRGISRTDGLLLLFFAGIFAGSILSNAFYPSLRDQAAFYVGLLGDAAKSEESGSGLFLSLCRQRGIQMFLVWLVGLTAYGYAGLGLFSGCAGVSVGAVLSILTAEKGIMGLPAFFMTVLPQACFYVPAWCTVLLWGCGRDRKFRPFPVLFSFLLLGTGCAAEAWLNPFFLRFLG